MNADNRIGWAAPIWARILIYISWLTVIFLAQVYGYRCVQLYGSIWLDFYSRHYYVPIFMVGIAWFMVVILTWAEGFKTSVLKKLVGKLRTVGWNEIVDKKAPMKWFQIPLDTNLISIFASLLFTCFVAFYSIFYLNLTPPSGQNIPRKYNFTLEFTLHDHPQDSKQEGKLESNISLTSYAPAPEEKLKLIGVNFDVKVNDGRLNKLLGNYSLQSEQGDIAKGSTLYRHVCETDNSVPIEKRISLIPKTLLATMSAETWLWPSTIDKIDLEPVNDAFFFGSREYPKDNRSKITYSLADKTRIIECKLRKILGTYYLFWIIFESFLFSAGATVCVRLILARKYRKAKVEIPYFLDNLKPTPTYVTLVTPPGERLITKEMLTALNEMGQSENHTRDVPGFCDQYPPDIFGVEFIGGEKTIPTSFINVWCKQAELFLSANANSQWADGSKDFFLSRKHMLLALNRAHKRAIDNRSKLRQEYDQEGFAFDKGQNDHKIPWFLEDGSTKSKIIQKLERPLAARILLVEDHSTSTLAFQTIVGFHNVTKLPLYCIKLRSRNSKNNRKLQLFINSIEKIRDEKTPTNGASSLPTIVKAFKNDGHYIFHERIDDTRCFDKKFDSLKQTRFHSEFKDWFAEEMDKVLRKSILDAEDEFLIIGYMTWHGFVDWRSNLSSPRKIKFYTLLHDNDIVLANDLLRIATSKNNRG